MLLVEDNRVNDRVARKILESMNCIVSHEENGLYGFQACIKEEFDIIFMDCQMPEMDGYESASQIRTAKESRNKFKPIVALTASNLKNNREKCFRVGMSDYLSKPIKRNDLLSILKIHYPNSF